MYRTILIRGHIIGVQPCTTADGIEYTHMVFDDTTLAGVLLDLIRPTGVLVYDSGVDDPEQLDTKFKGHEFASNEFVRLPIVNIPPEEG